MTLAMTRNAGPVMILAGGTGGHIFPGIAVAHALREAGVEVRWLGADGGMETRLVPPQGIALDTIPVKGVRGKGAAALFGLPLRLGRAVRAARAVLRAHRPRAVVSFGGYAAGPGGLAARALGIPLLVHEQNRAAGMTNRVLARIARRVLTGFPGTFANEVAVGNPVRDVITVVAPPAERLAGREGALRILVIGGSQGAQALNTGVPSALAAAQLSVEVRHQCGERQADAASDAYKKAGIAASIEPFITDMAAGYAWADVVICRAGALTLAELCAVGVPGILVPLPTAVDDHQTRNAQYLVDGDAALLVAQGERFEQRLADAIHALGSDPQRRRSMADAARALARPDAARNVARHILEVAA